MNSSSPKALILGSDYTGEINGRLGVAEWLGAEITHVPLALANAVADGHAAPIDFEGHDLLFGGTGEDTSDLGLRFAEKTGFPMTVFLSSILPDRLDPRILDYDLIVAPPHSELSGEKVLTILGVPHRFSPQQPTPEQISEEPKLALLLGGNTRYCDGFTPDYAARLGKRLLNQAHIWNGRFTITNSRRTPEEALKTLRQVLAPVETYFLEWSTAAPNEYQTLLQEADIIFCTGDSLSMCSEAAMTGKPLLVTCDEDAMEIYHLQTIQRMISEGHATAFSEPVKDYPEPNRVLDTTGLIGQKIMERLKARKRIQP
jgi:mitochondrial fission protein ELM1